MIQRKSTFFIGLFIILIVAFLGLPSAWKAGLLIVSGLALMALSVKITLPKRNIKPRVRRKEKVTQVFVESVPVEPRERETESRIDSTVLANSTSDSTL
jgi:hypothetical protein